MHPIVESKRAEIAALCRELGVRRLDVFGFALKEGLERLLKRPVDVVDAGAVRNPYFKAQVLATRELLYAA